MNWIYLLSGKKNLAGSFEHDKENLFSGNEGFSCLAEGLLATLRNSIIAASMISKFNINFLSLFDRVSVVVMLYIVDPNLYTSAF